MTPATAIATMGGLGRLPAPGTVGSAATLPIGFALHWAGGFPLFLLGLLAVTALGWWATAEHLKATGGEDPPEVIIDEAAGQLIALLPLSLGLWLAGLPGHVFPWPGWVGAFLLFRLFDIWKPWPISRLERLPGASGVMADDLAAGAAAAVLVAAAAAVAHG